MRSLIVIGSGAAGLSAALKAAELGGTVTILTGGPLLAGSSPRAQGGVAAAIGPDDAPSIHAQDTLTVGGGLNDQVAVSVLTREASTQAQLLVKHGMPFDADLGLEAGHQRRRILHAGGAATGQVLASALLERALGHPLITIYAFTPALRLLTNSERVIGVQTADATFEADAVVLATGGYAALWGRTTNAPESRGTGLLLAYDAGASLADLEFVQFHPTALNLPAEPAFLLSEALRGEGAVLLDADDQPVVDPLLPRDVVARAIHRHLLERGPVFLSLRHLDAERVRQRFPSLAEYLSQRGLDLARDRLPVAPAAHYCMGGVRTDTWGRTDVPGLYAAGEVACTGVQGANRLASNSLLECLVFGARAAEAALRDNAPAAWSTSTLPAAAIPAPVPDSTGRTAGCSASHATAGTAGCSTRSTIWSTSNLPAGTSGQRSAAAIARDLDAYLGVERTADGLRHLLQRLPETPEARIASFAATAGLLRQESRGAHSRTDYPSTEERWRGRVHWRRDHPPRFEEVQPQR